MGLLCRKRKIVAAMMQSEGQNLQLCGQAILGQVMIDKAISWAQGILCPIPALPPPAT